MDILLRLLDQRPRADWSWAFDGHGNHGDHGKAADFSTTNALALCNASLLTYSDDAEVQRFLGRWGFDGVRLLQRRSSCGFVARRGGDLVVAFRGTEPTNAVNWITDANCRLVAPPRHSGGRVHAGFAAAFDDIDSQMSAAITDLSRGDRPRIFVTGHSLGGAMAVLAAGAIDGDSDSASNSRVAGVYTFGQPRVGNRDYCAQYDDRLGDRTFRCVNDRDIVPHLPPARLPTILPDGEEFGHVGDLRMLVDGEAESGAENGARVRVTDDPAAWGDRVPVLPWENRRGALQALRAGEFLLWCAGNTRRVLDHDPAKGYVPRLERAR